MSVTKLIRADDAELIKDYTGRLGLDLGNLWDKLPSPMVEITKDDFNWSFLDSTPRYLTYHQSPKGTFKIWWYGDRVQGVRLDVVHARHEIGAYFRFGCEHEHEECTKLGNCWYRYKCKDCGYTHEVDSSD